MRCTRYNIGNDLPKYLKSGDEMVPCVPANFERLGILARVNATPEAGKIITKSHGELIDGEWREVIDEQLTSEEIEAAAKAPALKQAENDYLGLIDKINTDEGMTVEYKDNSAVIMEKATAAGLSMTKISYYGMLLQNAIREVELKGGSWYDLPDLPHNLEG